MLSSKSFKQLLTPAGLIILAGVLLRVLFLTRFPPGLNQDEVSSGYEAWALLRYGVDRNGFSFPVLFQSWGSGQNTLYSYISIPFIALLGLNAFAIRLPMALCGCASLFIVWHGLRGAEANDSEARDEGFGLCILAAIAFNPWAITASRWGLESNLLPFMLLLGLYFAKRGKLYVCAVVFGLSLYSYGTALLAVPLFLLGYCLYTRSFPWKQGLVFAAIAFPLVLCHIRNMLGLETMRLLCFTLPQLTQLRQSSVMSIDVKSNALAILRLLANQSDGLPWNSIPYFGLFWSIPGLLLVCNGVAQSIRRKENILTLILLGAGLLTALFVDGNINRLNINRLNMLMIPIILLQGYGIARLPKLRSVVLTLLPAACLMLIYVYVNVSAPAIEPYFQRDYANQQYIYDLFENKLPPKEFSESVEYLNPNGEFRFVRSFTANGKEYKYAY
ncbi:MAG: hypothetical protein LBN97_05905 [Oscillospiraceae bacterium]|nr:hypothetical protein [Oscillospiraceae bacterium]